MSSTKAELIERLELQLHPFEGGYFRRTYTSDYQLTVPFDEQPRDALSSIYYLLTDDSPIGYLHCNRADIIHYFHGGSALHYWIVHPDGQLERVVLGSDLANGEQLQLLVKGGCWKASRLPQGEYGLISEAVSPGFEYGDNELATPERIRSLFPELWDELAAVTKLGD